VPILKQSVADGHYYIHRWKSGEGFTTWQVSNDGVSILLRRGIRLHRPFDDGLFLDLRGSGRVYSLGLGVSVQRSPVDAPGRTRTPPNIRKYLESPANALRFFGMSCHAIDGTTQLAPLYVRILGERLWTYPTSAQDSKLVKPGGLAKWPGASNVAIDTPWTFGVRYPNSYANPSRHPQAIAWDVKPPVEILDLQDIGGAGAVLSELRHGLAANYVLASQVLVQVSENYGYGPFRTQLQGQVWKFHQMGTDVSQWRLPPDKEKCWFIVRGTPRCFMPPCDTSDMFA
jgi:hypothetical protein